MPHREQSITRRIRRALQMALLGIAALWRRCLFRTTFIAISGSVGKTSCTEVVGEVLASRYRTRRTKRGHNHYAGIARTILHVRPWHRYAVIEIGIERPGEMALFARAVKPDITIWTSVARTHTMNFRTLETTAAEKSLLVEGVRPGGIAILNDSNPYIAAYQPPSAITALRYGDTARSMCTASNVSSRWPARLSFDVRADSITVPVETRFVGTHWIDSLLPAFVVARIAGIQTRDAADVLRNYEPLPLRMAPVELPNGATILRDERNASIDTMAAALKVLGDATAGRRMILVSDVSDSKEKPRVRLRRLGREIAGVADAAVFVGEQCEHGARAAIEAGMRADQVWSFYNIEEAAAHVKRDLRSGDLLLVRGRVVDHMMRIYLSMVQDVECWINYCPKYTDCVHCSLLRKPRKKSPVSASA
jgi:UDP-N-acetylmuramoyl-tripeptide--D-alanyl-D-alanine ligase